mgnify:CR=1 FL=1
MHYPQKDERLLPKQTVVSSLWVSEILKFGIKQVDRGLISTVKRFQDPHWWTEELNTLEMLALLSLHG